MRTHRIEQAVRDIAKHEQALKWLNEYGVKLDGRDVDSADVLVRLRYAASCSGSTQAADVLSAYARLSLPELVKTAISSCRNTIEMSKAAIREELDSEESHP